MEWLTETNLLMFLPVFLVGFVAHKLGRTAAAMGCWLITLLIGLSSIAESADRIATLNKYPDAQSIVLGETALIFFTGFLAFPVIRFFLSGTKLMGYFNPRRDSNSAKIST